MFAVLPVLLAFAGSAQELLQETSDRYSNLKRIYRDYLFARYKVMLDGCFGFRVGFGAVPVSLIGAKWSKRRL